MTETDSSKRPTLTIGMPVYNGERFLPQALDSLLAQAFRDFELLISDNASTDSTPEICREYAARDSRIRVSRRSENVGIMANVTFVAENARGEYFMLVGDDDVYEPVFAERMIQLLSADHDLDMAYSNFAYVDPDGRIVPGKLKTFMSGSSACERNFQSFLRVRICLPMMMGVYRTTSFTRALPFVTFAEGMTGGIDLVFLFRFLTYAKVTSTNDVLFYYRLKDRSEASPARWRTSRWKLKWGQIRLNWVILSRHIVPILAASTFRTIDKIKLALYAALVFVADYSIVPFVQFVKARLRGTDRG